MKTWIVAGAVALSFARPSLADDACPEVRLAIEHELREGVDVAALRALGPRLDPAGALVLAERARREPGRGFLAIAATSHESVVLEAIRAGVVPRSSPERGLALFLLGDGTLTASVAAAWDRAPPTERRATAELLASQRNVLARALLERALLDPALEVRRVAASALVARGRSPRAEHVLAELAMAGGEEALGDFARLRELRAVAGAEGWPAWARGPALVEQAMRGRRELVRNARNDLTSDDADRRTIALALLASSGETPAALAQKAARSKERFGAPVEAALAALGALAGDEASLLALDRVPEAARASAALAWVSYAGLGSARAAIPEDRASRLVAAIATWSLSPAREDALLEALRRIGGRSALARARALVAAGRPVRGALLALAEQGESLPSVLRGAAALTGESRARVLAALSERCRPR